MDYTIRETWYACLVSKKVEIGQVREESVSLLQLYGYARCSTCREAKRTLTEAGADVQFHDIVASPPDATTIRRWLQCSGRPIEDFVNTRGTVYRQRDLKRAQFSEDEWIMELTRDGRLLKRPILETPDGEVYVGYHEGAYRRIAMGGGD